MTRNRAEAIFRAMQAQPVVVSKVPEMPARPVCGELMPSWMQIVPATRTVAWQIAMQRTRAQRQLIWNEVMYLWRDGVKRAVALLLASQYGCCSSAQEIRARIDAEVPIDLVQAVLEQSMVVFRLRRG